ncbi:MAG TPA: hypothetical protein VEX86_26095 [Longimicrobium sp.]|nr:hypothetical protein [Longimicrobium sp.]
MFPRPLPLVILSVLLCACVPTGPVQQPVRQPAPGPGVVERTLRAAAGGAEIPADLVVRYSDMHGMHGGTTISLTAHGTVQSRTVDPRTGSSERRGTIPPDSVRAVIQLLVELAAWEQRTPPRPPVPDESAAGLTIRAGGEEVRIWEWYNDMATNARLVRVLGRLRSFATDDSHAPPRPPPG